MWLEAKDDQDAVVTEEFYAGGGQVARRGLEHFPQLWCPAGSYSVYGQVCSCWRPQRVPEVPPAAAELLLVAQP